MDDAPTPVRERPMRPSHPAAVAVGLCCLALLLVELTFLLDAPEGASPGVVLQTATPALFFAAGISAWRRRPHNRIGPLLMLAGLALWSSNLAIAPLPLLQQVGQATATLPLALTLHLVLAYPTGRLRGRTAVVVVAVGYVVSTVLELPNRLLAGPLPDLAPVTSWVQTVVGVSCVLVAAALVARRSVAFTPAERRQVEPMVGYRIGVCVLIAVTAVIARPDTDARLLEVVGYVQLAAVAGLPVVFLLGLLGGAFGRAGEVSELMVRIGSATPTDHELSQAVSVALGDPGASVVYARAGRSGFVDGAGSPVAQPLPPGREVFEVEHDGRVVGGVLHRSSLADQPVLEVVAGIVAMAIDQRRLLAEQHELVDGLRAREVELQQSGRRLLQAEDHERRRIARDLHDGAQQHLVALGLRARQLSRSTSDPGAAAAADAVADGLVDLLDEFRGLIAGIMPAPLVERGLVPATELLAMRMPIPTRVVAPAGPERLPAETESTLYFMISESLTNVIKHAGASSVDVVLERGPVPGRVTVTVSDDGNGEVDPARGTGLRGLADRIATLGGTLTVQPRPGVGCTVTAEVPCA